MGLYDDNDSEVVRVGGGWAAASQQVIFGNLVCLFDKIWILVQKYFLLTKN